MCEQWADISINGNRLNIGEIKAALEAYEKAGETR